MRLDHEPLEFDVPDRFEHTWSVPLPGLGSRLGLVTIAGRAWIVLREGLAALDGRPPDGVARPDLALPAGRPGTAVAGALPWVTDDGRIFRLEPHGAVEMPRIRGDAALALDDERVLIAPRGAPGRVALVSGGSERWQTSGTFADACPGPGVMVTGVPGMPDRLTAIDLASGRTLWAESPEPHGMAAVVGVNDDLLWVACTDRTLAGLSLATGTLRCAHDTGVRVPTGTVDRTGRLHICHAAAWVSVRLAPGLDLRTRALSGLPRVIDPPIRLSGDRLLVRTVDGSMLLVGDSRVARIHPPGKPVWSVASTDGRLYFLEGDDPPVLHCLSGLSA
jgi:hypothetical protein